MEVKVYVHGARALFRRMLIGLEVSQGGHLAGLLQVDETPDARVQQALHIRTHFNLVRVAGIPACEQEFGFYPPGLH